MRRYIYAKERKAIATYQIIGQEDTLPVILDDSLFVYNRPVKLKTTTRKLKQQLYVNGVDIAYRFW